MAGALRVLEVFRVPADQFPSSKVWRILHQLADARSRAVRNGFLKAVAATQNAQTLADVTRELEAGRVEAAVDAIQWENVGAQEVQALLEPEFRFLATAPAKAGASGLPRGVTASLKLTNEEAVLWAEARAAELVREVSVDTRKTLRQLATDGIRNGVPPRTTARLMRSHVGLTARMSEWVQRKPLEQQAAYREYLIRWRAETIARTETIRAANMGQQFIWREAARQGLIDPATARRVWVVTPDDRLCSFCAPMDGQLVALEEEFRSGEIATSKGPRSLGSTLTPPLHPRCRCALALRPNGAKGRTGITPAPAPPAPKVPKKRVPSIPIATPGRTAFARKVDAVIGSGLADDAQAIRVGGAVREEWRRRLPVKERAAQKKLGAVQKRLEKLALERLALDAEFQRLTNLFIPPTPGGSVEQRAEMRRQIAIQLAAFRKKLLANGRALLKAGEDVARLSGPGLEREVLREVLAELRDMGGDLSMVKGSAGQLIFKDQVVPYYPKDWIDASNLKGDVKVKSISGRAYYRPASTFGNLPAEIVISDHGLSDPLQSLVDLRAAAAHELAHRFEDSTKDILRLEEVFFNRRTAGEQLGYLGSGPYGEAGFRDKWPHYYMGRTYSTPSNPRATRAYEIMSMAYEELIGRKDVGVLQDQELLDFALGLLAGAK